MYVKVLFDEKAKRGLLSGTGFSCLVEGKILFDTGEASTSLLENMGRMMVSPKDIEGVVISHEHWDHTGGLWELLKKKKGLKIYACPSFSDTFKNCVKELGGKLVLVKEPKEIADNIYVTGGIQGEHKGESIVEQALVVRGDKGESVITGCAHPGIVKMLRYIKKHFSIKEFYMVFGGMHLGSMDREKIGQLISDLKALGVKKAGPTHCSGDKARRMFKGRFHDSFVAVRAGYIIHL